MASTQAQKNASMKYERENTVQIPIKLNKKTDADIIEFFEKNQGSRMGFIKEAIREKMKKENTK